MNATEAKEIVLDQEDNSLDLNLEALSQLSWKNIKDDPMNFQIFFCATVIIAGGIRVILENQK